MKDCNKKYSRYNKVYQLEIFFFLNCFNGQSRSPVMFIVLKGHYMEQYVAWAMKRHEGVSMGLILNQFDRENVTCCRSR